MNPFCPKKECSGHCEERAGDWWYCSSCQCWYPGAHLRAKGALHKTERKTETPVKRKRGRPRKHPLVSSEVAVSEQREQSRESQAERAEVRQERMECQKRMRRVRRFKG
jgi:hypothetical protein